MKKMKGARKALSPALRLVLKEVRMYRWKVVLGGILVLVGSLMLLPRPFAMGYVIDVVFPNKDVRMLLIAVGLLFVVHLLKALQLYFVGILFYKVNNKIIIDIRRVLFEKLARVKLSEYKKYGTGYLMSRLKDDPHRLSILFGEKIIDMIKQVLTFIVGVSAMIYIEWKLALLSLMIIPLFVATTHYFGKKIKKQSSIAYETSARATKSLQENISLVELCRAFNRNLYNIRRYMKAVTLTYRDLVRLNRLEMLNAAFMSFIGTISPLLLLGYGGYQIIIGNITIGNFVTFMSLMNFVFGPASSFIGFNSEIQKLRVALFRIDEILALPEVSKDGDVFKKEIREIELKDIRFEYETGKPVLRGIHMKGKKGEKIGIMGSSGAGKSTLINIIMGLYEFEGSVLLNGEPVDRQMMNTLREKTALVEQEPFLFNDTIYNNVAFGNRKARRKDVIEALQKAHVWEFINGLKEKENTIIEERGSNLSVGQKQRIAIARALVRNPEILILDEATSNIDNVSEKYISDILDRINEEMIVFIVAHRLNTISGCHRIFVLNEGVIVEEGVHEDLLNKGGVYAQQYNRLS